MNGIIKWYLSIISVVLVVIIFLVLDLKGGLENKINEQVEKNNSLSIALTILEKDFYLANTDLPDIMTFHDYSFALDHQTKQKLRYYINKFKSQKWLLPELVDRLDSYQDIVLILKNNGWSKDLIFIATVESFLNPLPTSYAGARGFWQFIKTTGRRFGLVINYFIDERRDPYKSTDAAMKYFNYLRKRFDGKWPLIAAAYNWGEDRLIKHIKKRNSDDYFGLPLNRETRNYFIQVLAWKWIVENEEEFLLKFTPKNGNSLPPISEVKVKVRKNIKVSKIIYYFDENYHLFDKLNPIFYRYVIPKGTYQLKVPTAVKDDFLALFN